MGPQQCHAADSSSRLPVYIISPVVLRCCRLATPKHRQIGAILGSERAFSLKGNGPILAWLAQEDSGLRPRAERPMQPGGWRPRGVGPASVRASDSLRPESALAEPARRHFEWRAPPRHAMSTAWSHGIGPSRFWRARWEDTARRTYRSADEAPIVRKLQKVHTVFEWAGGGDNLRAGR